MTPSVSEDLGPDAQTAVSQGAAASARQSAHHSSGSGSFCR